MFNFKIVAPFVIGLLCATSAEATVIVRNSSMNAYVQFVDPALTKHVVQDWGIVDEIVLNETSGAPNPATGTAIARMGILKTRPTIPTTPGYSWADTRAGWNTEITFYNIDLWGTKGKAKIGLLMNYEITTVNDYRSTWTPGIIAMGGFNSSLTFNNNHGQVYSADYSHYVHDYGVDKWSYENIHHRIVDLNGETLQPGIEVDRLSMEVDFVWGTPVSISSALVSQCSVGNGSSGGSASCDVHAARSSYWAGITDVRDLAGNPVTSFTALNSVGGDFSRSLAPANEVPEPVSLYLTLLGLAIMLAKSGLRRTVTMAI